MLSDPLPRLRPPLGFVSRLVKVYLVTTLHSSLVGLSVRSDVHVLQIVVNIVL